MERTAAASQVHSNYVRLKTPRRIPSWSCISRENSSESLSEEIFAVAASSTQQGAALVVSTPTLAHHAQRNSHDGSESESETIDLNSWTRSGGPLMRTASADKFISFIHNLEIDTELTRACTVEGNAAGIWSEPTFPNDPPPNNSSSVTMPGRCTKNSETEACSTANTRASQASTPTSMAVCEGDLLQPDESTSNGILLNIVKRDALQASVTELAESSCSLDNDAFVASHQPRAGD